MIDPAPIRIETAPHYRWGAGCDGWHLVRAPGLSVIQERMPPATSETRHRHSKAQQFFYVLSGEAVIEIDGVRTKLHRNEGIRVPPGAAHRMQNLAKVALEFLVTSEPPTHGDRVELP